MTRIVIAADDFREDHMAQISQAVAGWGEITRIAQNTPDGQWAEPLRGAEIAFGGVPVQALKQSSLKLLQLGSVGYEGYRGKGLSQQKELTVCNARGTMNPEIAEHALAMMLGLVRNLPLHVRSAADRTWSRPPEYGELFESTVCILGLGDLGTALAERCAALGMRVVGARRDPSKSQNVAQHVYGLDELPQAVADADHVVAILPAAAETTRLIDDAVFAACKPGARFYNVGRGSTVDEPALVRHLQSGHLGGAGLDVFVEEPLPAESPLWSMDNVIITPHVAGRSNREYNRLCALLVDNLKRFHAGEPLRNVVKLDD